MGWARERGPRPINPLILREETVAEPYECRSRPEKSEAPDGLRREPQWVAAERTGYRSESGGKSVRLCFVPVRLVGRVFLTVLMLVVVVMVVIMVVVFGVRVRVGVGVVMPMIVFVVMRMIVHLHRRARRVDVPGVVVIVPGSKKHQREDDARRDGEYRARLRAAPVRPFEKFGRKPVERDEEEGRGRHHEGVGKKLLRPMEGR